MTTYRPKARPFTPTELEIVADYLYAQLGYAQTIARTDYEGGRTAQAAANFSHAEELNIALRHVTATLREKRRTQVAS